MISTLVFSLAIAGFQQPPPTPTDHLHADSLVVDSLMLGTGRSTWPFEFVRTEPHGETWVRLHDPFGGVFFGPTTMVAALGEEAVAYAEAREARSVIFLPRALTLSALSLIAFGVVSAAALPLVLYRRRYHSERRRRRAADAARRHLAEGREAERIRTAQDLHDGPVQDLHVLRMQLSLLARSVDDGQRETLEGVATEAQRVVDELRRVSEDLRPPALGPFGLSAALRAFTDRLSKRHPEIEFGLDLDDDAQALPDPVRIALFRIAQEAVTNATKHARPRRIDLAFRLDARGAALEVSDDGGGFDVPTDLSAPSKPGHYGLVGMAERAASARATLNVTSERGLGTRVHAVVSMDTLVATASMEPEP